MRTFYFTGTGNCLQVARSIGAGGKLVSIPSFLREHDKDTERIIIADDAVGLVFPTYWLAIPPIVAEFLKRVRLETDYLFAVATRGNASLTLKSHLLQVARENGHSLSYFNKLSMPDNYLPLCDMAREKQRFSEDILAQRIEKIAGDIRARRHNVSGIAGLTFLRPFLMPTASREMADFSHRFSMDSTCTGCATCVRVCTAQSIRLIDDSPVFGNVCNGCLACIHNCPAGAIHMQGEKSPERYLNPTVKTADLMSANS